MYRIIIFSLQLIFLIAILTFILLTNPFIISLDIGNLKYSFFKFILNYFSNVPFNDLFICFYIFFKSRLSLGNYFLKNKYKKLERGYQYFVEAMIAISNKDNKSAIKFHKKMNNYLKNDPSLSLLLQSEVYKIEKKYNELSEVYEIMIQIKKY